MISPDLHSTGESTIKGLVYELRPWQWYKQLVLYIAIVFSGSAGELEAWAHVTAGAVLFSLVAGCTYILNDVSDVEEDRRHPRKRHRPIASGQVPISLAVLSAVAGYIGAGIAAWWLTSLLFAILVIYVVQNVVYSYILKSIVFVDLLSISAGFVLRAIAGVVLVGATLSPWLLLCTFLAALMFGISKRWGEREEVESPSDVRASLDGYSEAMLQFMFGSVATTLLISYSLYTFFAQTIEMMLTIPFAFYAVFRFAQLMFLEEGASRPQEQLMDRALLANFAVWGGITLLILYRIPAKIGL